MMTTTTAELLLTAVFFFNKLQLLLYNGRSMRCMSVATAIYTAIIVGYAGEMMISPCFIFILRTWFTASLSPQKSTLKSCGRVPRRLSHVVHCPCLAQPGLLLYLFEKQTWTTMIQQYSCCATVTVVVSYAIRGVFTC